MLIRVFSICATEGLSLSLAVISMMELSGCTRGIVVFGRSSETFGSERYFSRVEHVLAVFNGRWSTIG